MEQIKTLLRAAGDQNSAVSQSRSRIHSRSVRVDTVQSAHSPRSPLRHGGHDHRQDRYLGRAHREYDREYARNNYRRAPSPLPRDGSYAPRRNDDRRPYGNDHRVSVDPREPGFNARSVLVQGLVVRNRAYREGLDRDRPSGGRVHVSGLECFGRASEPLRFLITSDWQLASASLQASRSPILRSKTTEWLCTLVAAVMRWP